MRFSEWFPPDQIDAQATAVPGLFQAKVRQGLLSYPNGKSAMFYYGYAQDLKGGTTYFCEKILPKLATEPESLLIRWMAATDIERRFQNHLNTFFNNFGALPLGNQLWLDQNPG